MDYSRNPKVIGAFLIGFALVAGAYVTSTFGQPRVQNTAALSAASGDAPTRVFIPVADTDADGVEDWRDQFVQAPAVKISELTADDYTPPTTLTGQVGITLMEDLMRLKGGGPVASTEEQILKETVAGLTVAATSDKIYDIKDIVLQPTTTNESIRAYGNALAEILIRYNATGLPSELLILSDYLDMPTAENAAKLTKLATTYKNYRDNTLTTPVPKIFVKPHLDLINVYNALYVDIAAMADTGVDPMMTFLRLKRYEDDATGLRYALDNMYNAVVPYANVFGPNDPAAVFAKFSSDFQ